MANPSILAAFERMWQHIVAFVNSKNAETKDYVDEKLGEIENLLSQI